eukprot:COSAG01_NODE_17412_length_1153_cov_3.374763_1_plen_130_part_10
MPHPTDSGTDVDHRAASARQGQGAGVHEQAPRVDAGAVGDRHAAARNGRRPILRHRKSTTSIGSAQPLAAGLIAALRIGEDGVDSSSSGRSGGGANDGSHAGAGLPQHAAGHTDRPGSSVAAVPAPVPGG